MSLSVAKVTKNLQIIVSIWCKISRKNICKSMENRTLRDTRSVKEHVPFNTHSGNGVVIDCGLPHDNLSERPKRTGRKVVVRWSDHDSKHASLQSRSANVKLQKCDKIDEDRKS